MPRMLRRAAVLGATAHVASNRGQAKAEAAAAAAGTAASGRTPAGTAGGACTDLRDSYDDLMKLEELLDAGVLTQAEFDAQKQKILSA